MAKNPRLYEVAKALGMPAKNLMAELAKEGFEFKTHMASLESDVMSLLKKKYPDLDALMKSQAQEKKAAASKSTKPKSSRAKSSKMITQRSISQTEKQQEEPSPLENLGRPEVEIVEKEGEAVEQKVISGGIIRRRRVENLPAASAPSSAPTSASPAEPEPSIEEPKLGPAEQLPQEAEVEVEAQAPQEVESREVTAPVEQSVQEVKVQPEERRVEPTRSGRNLSAPRRLKIVGESSPPRPATAVRPAQESRKPTDLQASQQAKKLMKRKPAEELEKAKTEEEAPAFERRESAVKKKPAVSLKNWVAPRVTKKDLFGMTEEVEITRLGGRRGKKQAPRVEKKTRITTPGASKRKIRIEQEITVADLADRMGVKAADVVRKLISMGQMVSAHQLIDFDTASLIASEYDYEVQNVAQTAESLIRADVKEATEDLGDATEPRPPVVTIMGHVDHGKTSLLDYIRKTRVAAGEAGGITQHIGAYQVEVNSKKITFLDTPGHEAFTKMRARGASATDIVVLVVAADEGVKPQTLEALAHAKAAKVPIIVAINKIDKPEAQPDRVIQELSAHDLVPEDWGGDTIYSKVSAHTGQGVQELLEMILLQAEILELRANSNRPARGIVVESRLDKGKGPVAAVVITNGTLRQGDPIVCSTSYGKVRAMFNDLGQAVREAGPSTPVEILGFNSVPEAGEVLTAVSEEGVAKKASDLALAAKKQEDQRRAARVSLEEMYKRMKAGEINELRVIVKADVQGSVEAIADSLEKIQHKDVGVNIVYKAVGGVSESDVSLAAASGAIIVGFNVRPTNQAKQLAARENIQIKTYSIIYELIDDVKMALQGLLAPVIKEKVLGQAEVRNVFNLSKVGIIAGCYVKSGKILRNASGRLIRDSVVIYDAKIASLRRFKEDVREVAEGFECGIRLENYSDLKVGDIIECYEKVEMAAAVSS